METQTDGQGSGQFEIVEIAITVDSNLAGKAETVDALKQEMV